MKTSLHTAGWALLLLVLGSNGRAAEVREFEENGIRYRETRTRVRRPVREVQEVQREETVYRESFKTEMQPTQQVRYVPSTYYDWRERWHNWWNPFAEPYLTYERQSFTVWHPEWQTVSLPVTRRERIPEKRTVRVREPVLRFVEREEVSRVVVSSPPSPTSDSGGPWSVARRERFGGISRLENDPPRYGAKFDADGWTVRR